MDEKESLAKNLKFLRRLYGLSMSELALILNFKNKSTIAQLETIKMLPSFETLINIANVFAVNMDWLTGRTYESYNDAIITELEERLMDVKLADNTVFRDIVPDFYLDSSIRNVGFSLFDRANLIFLLQFLKAVTEKYPQVLFKNIDVDFLKSLAKRKSARKRWSKELDELYTQLLHFIAVEFYK